MEPIDLEAEFQALDPDCYEIFDLTTALNVPISKPKASPPPILPPQPLPVHTVLPPTSPPRKPVVNRLNHIQAVLHKNQKIKGMGLTQLREWKKRLEEKKETVTAPDSKAIPKTEPVKRKRDSSTNANVEQYLKEIHEGNQRKEAETLKRRQLRPLVKEEPLTTQTTAPVSLTKEEERNISLRLRYLNRYQTDGFFSYVLSLTVQSISEKTQPAGLPLRFADGVEFAGAFTPTFFEEVRSDLENCMGQADLSAAGKYILQCHHEAGGFVYLAHVFDSSSRCAMLSANFRTDEVVLCILDTGVDIAPKITPDSRLFALHFLGAVHQDQDTNGKSTGGFFIRAKSSEELKAATEHPRVFYVVFLEYAQTMLREYRMIHLAEFLGLPRLLNPGTPEDYPAPTYSVTANFLTPALNPSQVEAITAALSPFPEVTLIQGPPGTGKTHTLMCLLSLILQRSDSARPILVCAPSNAAIDEIVVRAVRDGFVDHKGEKREDVKLVRVGNREKDKLELKQRSQPERGEPGSEVLQVSLHQLVTKQLMGLGLQEDRAAVNSLRKKLDKLDTQIAKSQEKHNVERFDKLREKRKDTLIALNREKSSNTLFEDKKRSAEFEILASADVIFSTLSGAASKCLEKLARCFEYVVIDEACQAVELTSLIPLQYRARKVVLIGDPKQLPATTFSENAVRAGYNRSLFERLMTAGVPVFMLKDQYRMSPALCAFPSAEFYSGALVSSPQLRPPPRWLPLCRLLFIDLKSSGESKGEDDSVSLSNSAEAAFVTQIYNRFSQFHGTKMNIGVITPYRKQVQAIKKALGEKFASRWMKDVEVNTVDGFQGREKDAVIFSAVRSKGQIGFLKDVRRLNVAITRARFALWIVGKAETLQTNETWARFIGHCERQRALIRAHTFAEVSSRFVD